MEQKPEIYFYLLYLKRSFKLKRMQKNLLLIFLLIIIRIQAQQTADILIKNGKIVDGTGNSWFYGDVAVTHDSIVAVGQLGSWKAAKEIDATGHRGLRRKGGAVAAVFPANSGADVPHEKACA